MRDDSRTGWTDGDMLSCTQHLLRFASGIQSILRQFDPPVTEALRDPETLTLTWLLELRKPRASSPGLHGPPGVNGSHPAEAPPEALKNVGFKTIVGPGPREPVTSFGHSRHKRLDVPRCGSIQWIRTDCDLHGLEKHPWFKPPMQ